MHAWTTYEAYSTVQYDGKMSRKLTSVIANRQDQLCTKLPQSVRDENMSYFFTACNFYDFDSESRLQ